MKKTPFVLNNLPYIFSFENSYKFELINYREIDVDEGVSVYEENYYSFLIEPAKNRKVKKPKIFSSIVFISLHEALTRYRQTMSSKDVLILPRPKVKIVENFLSKRKDNYLFVGFIESSDYSKEKYETGVEGYEQLLHKRYFWGMGNLFRLEDVF